MATITKRWSRATGKVFNYMYITPTGGIVTTKKRSDDKRLKLKSKTLINLDYSEISAEDIVTPVRSEMIEGKLQTLATFKVTYRLRMALPKWLQKLFKEYVIADAYTYRLQDGIKRRIPATEVNDYDRLRNELEKLLPEGFVISDRGYQPQSGFITLEKTDFNTQYAHPTLKHYAKLAYAIVRRYQKKVLKGAIQNGYSFPERLRWQRTLLAGLGEIQ